MSGFWETINSDRSIVDTLGGSETGSEVGGQTTDGVTAATVGTGLLDGIFLGSSNIGSSVFSEVLSVAGGVNTFMTHDPAIHGPDALTERTAMGMIDGAWGLYGGPAAVADAATGGNIAGGMKALAGLAMTGLDAPYAGNTDAYHRHVDSMVDGNFGALAGLGGVALDALGQLSDMREGALSGGPKEFDSGAWDRYSDGLIEGKMGGVMGGVGVLADGVAQAPGMLWDWASGDYVPEYDSSNADRYVASMKDAGPLSPFSWLFNAIDGEESDE